MSDRGTVINGLEELQAWLKHLQTVGYHGDIPEYRERELTVTDALALLREGRELLRPRPRGRVERFWVCGECGAEISKGDAFCRMCGREAVW
jgi:hypothetical protein